MLSISVLFLIVSCNTSTQFNDTRKVYVEPPKLKKGITLDELGAYTAALKKSLKQERLANSK